MPPTYDPAGHSDLSGHEHRKDVANHDVQIPGSVRRMIWRAWKVPWSRTPASFISTSRRSNAAIAVRRGALDLDGVRRHVEWRDFSGSFELLNMAGLRNYLIANYAQEDFDEWGKIGGHCDLHVTARPRGRPQGPAETEPWNEAAEFTHASI